MAAEPQWIAVRKARVNERMEEIGLARPEMLMAQWQDYRWSEEELAWLQRLTTE